MYNPYPVLFKLCDFVDPEKFAQTLVKNLQAHPAFLSVIEEHNGIPVQKYDPAKVPFIPVEKISEADLLSIKDDLIQPLDSMEDLSQGSECLSQIRAATYSPTIIT